MTKIRKMRKYKIKEIKKTTKIYKWLTQINNLHKALNYKRLKTFIYKKLKNIK